MLILRTTTRDLPRLRLRRCSQEEAARTAQVKPSDPRRHAGQAHRFPEHEEGAAQQGDVLGSR